LLACLLAAALPLAGQNYTDDVHIVPRANSSDEIAESIPSGLRAYSPPIKVNVGLVLVPVTVVDDYSRLVVGLAKNNFQVYEGKQAIDIQNFSREDGPVSVGIVLDCSGSMNDKMQRAREAISEFLESANPQDEFFLVSFSDTPQLMGDFTQSIEEIQGRLPTVFPRGRTSLIDAVYLALDKMRSARYQRRALLVISDGGDNHSRYTVGELTHAVREADTLIYAIGLYDYRFATIEERMGPELLDDISSVTGGRSFTIDNPNELSAVAKYVGKALRNQYVLAYRPSDKNDGKWRKIRIKLRLLPKGVPHLRIYAKTGYYAPLK
jgi:Ca-activated chloride channel family protein